MQQTELKGLIGGVTRPMKPAPQALVEACRNGMDAIRLCIQLSGHQQYFLADRLGIDRGHMSRIMSGRAYFPDQLRGRLMRLCGNYAPAQFDAHDLGMALVIKPVRPAEADSSQPAELRRVG